MEDNVKAVDLELSKNDLEKIEEILKQYPNTGERYSVKENNFKGKS